MPTPPPNDWFAARDEFLKQVGTCITRWAAVDDELFRIFHECVGGTPKQCAILYYRISGLDQRFATTDELVRSVLPVKDVREGSHNPREVQLWEAAIKGYQDLLHKRRLIAHQPLQVKLDQYYIKHPHELWMPGPKYGIPPHVIYESESERLRERGKNKGIPLDISHLRDHVNFVSSLQFRLHHFLNETLLPYLRVSRAPNP